MDEEVPSEMMSDEGPSTVVSEESTSDLEPDDVEEAHTSAKPENVVEESADDDEVPDGLQDSHGWWKRFAAKINLKQYLRKARDSMKKIVGLVFRRKNDR
jgi:hypothetical protein